MVRISTQLAGRRGRLHAAVIVRYRPSVMDPWCPAMANLKGSDSGGRADAISLNGYSQPESDIHAPIGIIG